MFFLRLLIEIGLDLRKIFNLRFLIKYFSDRKKWLNSNGVIDEHKPILSDFLSNNANNTDKQYFYQDLLVSQYIFRNKPSRHIDFGSRIDGFVSHVASFRKIEVFDIRNLEIENENIFFKRFDLLKDDIKEKTDSLSCLHTIEHIGLGRYGDAIAKNGYAIALRKMITLLSENGIFYLSFPISIKNKIEFNNQRIFSPEYILSLDCVNQKLELVRFDFVDKYGLINLNQNVKKIDPKKIEKNSCGIFTFRKK